MKETIEAIALITDTNRSPISIIANGKVRTLETAMKEAIGERLNIFS